MSHHQIRYDFKFQLLIQINNTDAISYLIEKDPGTVNMTDNYLQTPLFKATMGKNIPVMELLYSNGVDVNALAYDSFVLDKTLPPSTSALHVRNRIFVLKNTQRKNYILGTICIGFIIFLDFQQLWQLYRNFQMATRSRR